MSTNKKDPLRILTVNNYDTVAESFMGEKERRSYLIIDDNLDSRVTLIRGRYMENLLKAVSYLAPIHNKLDGITPHSEQGYKEYGDYGDILNTDTPIDSDFYIPIVSQSNLEPAGFSFGLGNENIAFQTENQRRLQRQPSHA